MGGVKDHLRHLRGGKALPHRTGRVASEVGGVDVDFDFWLLFASFCFFHCGTVKFGILYCTCKDL